MAKFVALVFASCLFGVVAGDLLCIFLGNCPPLNTCENTQTRQTSMGNVTSQSMYSCTVNGASCKCNQGSLATGKPYNLSMASNFIACRDDAIIQKTSQVSLPAILIIPATIYKDNITKSINEHTPNVTITTTIIQRHVLRADNNSEIATVTATWNEKENATDDSTFQSGQYRVWIQDVIECIGNGNSSSDLVVGCKFGKDNATGAFNYNTSTYGEVVGPLLGQAAEALTFLNINITSCVIEIALKMSNFVVGFLEIEVALPILTFDPIIDTQVETALDIMD